MFRSIGDNVSLQLRKIPLYPKCISFHNNIVVASNVLFLTHDAIHLVFNRCQSKKVFLENIGCIEIMDNCFIGANSIIMPNVKIGPNSIVAAGSCVNKDIGAGEVWGGVPAKCIGSFEDLMAKRTDILSEQRIQKSQQQPITKETVDFYWNLFELMHESE